VDDDGLSLVLGYRLTQVAAYAPAGPNESHRQYEGVMRIGEKKDENRILVTVGH